MLLTSLGVALSPGRGLAQQQIKPYFLLIFDTSGSMAWDANDDNVGETDPTSRMYQAKTAVGNVINSTGDAAFGLERFRQSCTPATNGCSCSGANDPCGTRNGGEVLIGISEENQIQILEWVDRDNPGQNAVCDYDRNLYELRANGRTPLEGSLADALTYYQGGVLNAWSQDYLGANVAWPSPIAEDQVRVPAVDACRPYAVILLTDGNETCGGTPGDGSTLLRTTTVNGQQYDVRTWVIGFGVTGPDADLEAIARAGGTDNPGDGLGAGTLEAFYPQDDVDLALALSQIIQDTLLVEECNGVDDDCDGLVDEGVTNACGSCGPLVEVCNGADDDCDGLTDEGFSLYCDRPRAVFTQTLCADPGERACDLQDDNCNGAIDENGVCNGCVPSAEICDGLDNDCDGLADDGVTRPCGTDVGACVRGIQSCAAGAWGACSGQGPVPESCNGLDDDCNGVVDGMLQACGTDAGECQAGLQRCSAGAYGDCFGEIGPTADVCDGLDNDCDGQADEGNPGGGAVCGTDAGECQSGTFVCDAGQLVCSGVGPAPEVCDTLDNDCNGLVDDGNPEGGFPCGLPTEGDCSDGVLVCADGVLECVGAQGPTPEVCDDHDNDCNGLPDDGNPGGGAPCGSDVGACVAGAERCLGGAIVCDGEAPPAEEICDLEDNDCDGEADEGLPIGEPCGTDLGECLPGVFLCTDGQPQCQGEVPPSDEVCDGLDNDCDGDIDEGLPLGEECGDPAGLCVRGRMQCVDGVPECAGGQLSQEERCDCEDNDCDGTVDEDPEAICPPGSRCLDCSCALPCSGDQEFPCPPDRRCVDGYCVSNPCAGVVCARGERCLQGACVSRCEGVVCEAGLRCAAGLCEVDDCYHFPEDCAAGESCIDGRCQEHPCRDVVCESGQYCRAGACVATCVDVSCGRGEACTDGACVPDPCAGIVCREEGSLCDPSTGSCADDPCAGVDCPLGDVCDRASGGDCVGDPCQVTVCAGADVCVRGVCGPPGGGQQPKSRTHRILATGGGGAGCDCSAAGSGPAGSGGPWALAFALFLGVALFRPRRTPAGGPMRPRRDRALPMVVAVLAVLGGPGACQVDPYCVDCPPGAGGGGDDDGGGGGDAGGWSRLDAGGGDGGVADGGEPGCEPGAPERCNGADDDCDGEVDEDIDFTSPAHCGSCDNVCAIDHAFPRCDDGLCAIDRCDVGFHDLNEDEADGCEYGCLPRGQDDTDCNGVDDDCDGLVDEDVDGLTDPAHCGVGDLGRPRCGNRCTPLHGAGSCVGGECQIDDCEGGFVDANHLVADGCELRCTPTGAEDCDARDDDCNGLIDDGNPGGGAGCGSNLGACRPGTLTCELGRYVCDGEVAPTAERCNLADDDCDGEVDEGNPEGGALCGSDEGACVAGRLTCVNGAVECVGVVGSLPEACDGIDNDCDGRIDDGNPGGGLPCGPAGGACVQGTETCVGGVIACRGGVGPTIEVCNHVDDDCDGATDETFDFANDADNCGDCGTVCAFPNAYAVCNAGDCDILACVSGFIDLDGLQPDGCEVACDSFGAEVCNGLDDDCNGTPDDGLQAPAGLCNPNGACAGAGATCEGASGWRCQYGATVQKDALGNILPETWCDGRDNDCDGLVDEHAPLRGTACSNGIGSCRRTGRYVCDAADVMAPVVCDALAAGQPGVEECNGLDDDCDGVEDDGIVDDMVQVAGANLWIYRYEASRGDATVDDPGVHAGRPCSRGGVLPWTDVTWEEANAACSAAGKRLCTAAEWQDACEAVTNSCDWSYDDTVGFECQPGPTAYEPTACNGNDYDYDPNMAGDQDGLLATGALPHCGADQEAGNPLVLVQDLSGNAKEWTSTDPPGGGVEYRILGGSYNNPADGLQCSFQFTVGQSSFHFPNVGFRCCSSVGP